MNPLQSFDILWILMNQFIDKGSLANCSRVCKLWNYCATSVKWGSRFMTLRHLGRLSSIYPMEPPIQILDRVKNLIINGESLLNSNIPQSWLKGCRFPSMETLIIQNYCAAIHPIIISMGFTRVGRKLGTLEIEISNWESSLENGIIALIQEIPAYNFVINVPSSQCKFLDFLCNHCRFERLTLTFEDEILAIDQLIALKQLIPRYSSVGLFTDRMQIERMDPVDQDQLMLKLCLPSSSNEIIPYLNPSILELCAVTVDSATKFDETFPFLKHLSIIATNDISQLNVMEIMAKFPNVQSLELELYNLNVFEAKHTMDQVHKISIIVHEITSISAILSFLVLFPSLQELQLSLITPLTISDIAHIKGVMKNLVSIDQNIDDESNK